GRGRGEGAGVLEGGAGGGDGGRGRGRAVRGRGRARSVSGVRARRAPARRLAALARGGEPGRAGTGLAWPRLDRAHAALRGRFEPLMRNDGLWKSSCERTYSIWARRATWSR